MIISGYYSVERICNKYGQNILGKKIEIDDYGAKLILKIIKVTDINIHARCDLRHWVYTLGGMKMIKILDQGFDDSIDNALSLVYDKGR